MINVPYSIKVLTKGVPKISSLSHLIAKISTHCSPLQRLNVGPAKINFATCLKYAQHARVSMEGGQVGAALGYFGFALEYFIGVHVSIFQEQSWRLTSRRLSSDTNCLFKNL